MGKIQSIQEQMLLKFLLFKSRPGRIKSFLDSKSYCHAEPSQSNQVTVAAVQGKLSLVNNPIEYADIMYQYVEEAVRQGAQLVVFPEDNAAHLVGMLPGISENVDIAQTMADLGSEVKVADIFNYLSPVTKQVFETVFSYLAAHFRVHIMAGSILVSDGKNKTINQAYLFGPDGAIIGRQQKLHLLPLELDWGLSCGEELSVFPTPVGKLAFPICMDATYFETFRSSVLKGAETVIIPAANPDKYNFWKELRGVWPRVQESAVFGIRSCMVGQLLGITLTGRSGIYTPLELTPKKDGILAEAKTYDEHEIIVANLDYNLLRDYRRNEGFMNYLNIDLCKRYLPHLYK